MLQMTFFFFPEVIDFVTGRVKNMEKEGIAQNQYSFPPFSTMLFKDLFLR